MSKHKDTKRKTVAARLSLASSMQFKDLIEATGRVSAHLVVSAIEEYLNKAQHRMGTLIRGTHRRQDLIPVFCAQLYLLNPVVAEKEFHEFFHDESEPLHGLWECARGCREWPADDHRVWEDNDLHFLIMSLEDGLNEEALEGMYFGAHPGDGSDYGFWAFGE